MEIRESDQKREIRSIGELRSVDEDGTFEGYLTVWDTVDDYNSTFTRGSFKKTIQERGNKVKILFDHEHLIGSSIELREDDHGVFGRGKLNLDVEKAKEAYEFMKDGTLDGLSFGFRTIKEGFVNGVRQIKEVMLYEFGPNTFPANDEALITDVRSQDFTESLNDEGLDEEAWILKRALQSTLSDIWWASDTTSENVIPKLDSGLADFHAAYLDYAQRWIARYWVQGSEFRSSPFDNDLSNTFSKHLLETRKSILDIAGSSEFTVGELQKLKQGELIDNRSKLTTLSNDVQLAHREQRNKAVETLCSELRGSLTNSEKTRIRALLEPVIESQSEPTLESEIRGLTEFFSKVGEK